MHAEDDRWPRKNIGQTITANKGAVLGAKFAMQFAALCGLSTQVAVA